MRSPGDLHLNDSLFIIHYSLMKKPPHPNGYRGVKNAVPPYFPAKTRASLSAVTCAHAEAEAKAVHLGGSGAMFKPFPLRLAPTGVSLAGAFV